MERKENGAMTEEKKDGFFKRLFGGKKEGCCGIKIEEVPKESAEKESDSPSSSDSRSSSEETA